MQDLITRIQVWLSYLMRLSFVFSGMTSLLQGNWNIVVVSVLGILCLSFPAFLKHNYKILLPTEFEFILTAFIYSSLLLGNIQGVYELFWWWDIALHTLSGIALGFIGFLMLYPLYQQNRLQTSPFIFAVFSFSFAMAFGALWEVFEFSMDTFFGSNMQRTGLDDTMLDIMVDALGALIAAVIGYAHMKHGRIKIGLFDYFLTKFFEKNAHIVQKMKRKQ